MLKSGFSMRVPKRISAKGRYDFAKSRYDPLTDRGNDGTFEAYFRNNLHEPGLIRDMKCNPPLYPWSPVAPPEAGKPSKEGTFETMHNRKLTQTAL